MKTKETLYAVLIEEPHHPKANHLALGSEATPALFCLHARAEDFADKLKPVLPKRRIKVVRVTCTLEWK